MLNYLLPRNLEGPYEPPPFGPPAVAAEAVRRLAGNTWNYQAQVALREYLLHLPDDGFLELFRTLLENPGPVPESWAASAILGWPRLHRLRFSAGDALTILSRMAAGPQRDHFYPWWEEPLLRLAVEILRRRPSHDPDWQTALSMLFGLLADSPEALGEVTRLGVNLLHERAPDLLPRLIDRWAGRGGISGEQIAALQKRLPESPEGAIDLLLLLVKATTPQPSRAWLRRWDELKAALSEAALREALVQVVKLFHPEHLRRRAEELGHPAALDMPARDIARGALWALGDFPQSDIRDFLGDTLVAWSRSGEGNPPLGRAALWALARPGDEESLMRLHALLPRVRHRALRKRQQADLEKLARQHGVTVEDLADRAASDHGLDSRGGREWDLDGYRVRVQITEEGKVERTVAGPKGKTRRSLPEAARKSYPRVWKAIQAETKALGKTLTLQKGRMEAAMVDDRRWEAARWPELIGQHPILGHLARRLVWAVFTGGGERVACAMPGEDGAWRDMDGRPVGVPADAWLRPAHPVELRPEEQADWQRFLVAEHIVQPFKQMFRETYVLTPAEEATEDHSNRFRGQRVALRQVYALTRGRGWEGKLGLYGFDGAGVGWRDFPARGVRAALRHDWGDGPDATLQEVTFHAIFPRWSGTGPWGDRLLLKDVDPVAFSEAMRDVDLLAAVSSLGTEARWRAWEEQRQARQASWEAQRSAYEGMASASAEMRAGLLRELLPALGLEETVKLEGRFALIHGQRSDYRVHLGSGNIHLEPSGRYLCVVPARGNLESLYLPFEDDAKTAEVMSKIMVLAHDGQILDPSILRQLPRSFGD